MTYAQMRQPLGRWMRGTVGCAGLMLGALLAGATTVLFDDASSMRWLQPTPANIAAMARCDGVHGTAARGACVEAVVAAAQARSGATRLAATAAAGGTLQATD